MAQQQEDRYTQLIREVFGNAKGEELLEAWQVLYGDRPSFMEGVPTEEVFLREGERRFYLVLKGIIQQPRTKN